MSAPILTRLAFVNYQLDRPEGLQIKVDPDGETGDGDSEADQNDAGEEATREPDTADNATAKRRKVVNDAVAYIRSLAERRDRNADWAERAVREGVSLSAEAALEAGVVEYIVPDSRALLAAIDGTSVETRGGTRRLAVADRAIEVREPGWRTRFPSIITQPTVAYLLFMIGIYGLILEALNPGGAVPGVIGGISLLCALYAFQILPIDYAGLALLVLGVALMIAALTLIAVTWSIARPDRRVWPPQTFGPTVWVVGGEIDAVIGSIGPTGKIGVDLREQPAERSKACKSR